MARENPRVLLVFPNKPIISEPCCEGFNQSKIIPYELATSATSLRKVSQLKVLDAKAESLPLNAVKARIASFKPDIVVLWTVTLTYISDLKLLEFAKSIHAKTVLVMNPPILLRQVLERFPFVDFAVHDERPFVLKELVDELSCFGSFEKIRGIVFRSGGEVIDNGRAFVKADYAHPSASFDLLPMERYATENAVIKSSTGCPHQCTFCFWGKSKWRANPLDQTLNEIELLVKRYGAKNIGFSEQHFTLDRNRVFEFSEAVAKRNLQFKFFCDARVNHVDRDLLTAMKSAGLSRIFYGVEHVSDEILQNIKKNQTRHQILAAVNTTKALKIPFVLPFIIGLPGETDETIKELKKFIFEVKPWNYHVLFPVPYPGTALFDQAKKNNWLCVEEKPENFWVSPDFYKPLMVVPPMTEAKLIKARRVLQFYPRMHPQIFWNTVRDAYARGGVTKLRQVFEGGIRMAASKSVANSCSN
ncbi:MAG: radical SAM protein [Candidatus Diapherotrites archaeon]|nr:radical SAM protein [Candidatus Diapherotrites archaeon]